MEDERKKDRKKRDIFGTIFLSVGIVLVNAAVFLLLFNVWRDYKAGKEAMAYLEMIKDLLDQEDDDAGLYDDLIESDDEMIAVEIDGYYYIGYLYFPSLELELPVQSSWDYKKLEISPCLYYGATTEDNFVICGHNYSSHFGTLKNLESGDDVYFTDMNGKTWHYEVKRVEILYPTAISKMKFSNYDLTLFTCTYGGKTRVTVRCDLVD